MKTHTFILVLLFLMVFGNILAQNKKNTQSNSDSTNLFFIRLSTGEQYIGSLKEKNDSFSVFKTSFANSLEISNKKISKLIPIDSSFIHNGEYWLPNSDRTRYVFGTSAFNLKKGEGYFQNTMLTINSVHYGITDNISIGGGIELLSTFASLSSNNSVTPIFYITPKIGFELKKQIHVAAGIMIANVPETGGVGFSYVMSTFGTPDHQLSISTGLGFQNGVWNNSPFISLAGLTRVSKKIALITENWFLTSNGEYAGYFSYGIRFLNEKSAFDFAFINSKEIAKTFVIGIPTVSVSIKF
jgi:hypothetical protein